MYEDGGHTAGRHGPGSRQSGQREARRREALARIAIPGLAIVAMSGFGGCTFMEQTDDLMTGGPAKRVEAAEQRQQQALIEQERLKRTRQAVIEQQAAEVDSLMAMRKDLEMQEAKLAQMRADQQIAEEEERALHRRITSLNGDIQSLELALQASRTTGETESAESLEERLRALKLQAEELNQEIQLLEE